MKVFSTPFLNYWSKIFTCICLFALPYPTCSAGIQLNPNNHAIPRQTLHWEKSPSKKLVHLELYPKSQTFSEAESEEILESTDEDQYLGKSRKQAKTSLVEAPIEEITLDTLINELKEKIPPGLVEEREGYDHRKRVPEEKRNVRVEAWLHFYSLEDDNDFHLIIGTNKKYNEGQRMNVEISGLNYDNKSSLPTLKKVRQAFKEAIGSFETINWPNAYIRINPVRVRVTGPLFYDTDHRDPVGPKGYRTATNWEIHPISEIEFEE